MSLCLVTKTSSLQTGSVKPYYQGHTCMHDALWLSPANNHRESISKKVEAQTERPFYPLALILWPGLSSLNFFLWPLEPSTCQRIYSCPQLSPSVSGKANLWGIKIIKIKLSSLSILSILRWVLCLKWLRRDAGDPVWIKENTNQERPKHLPRDTIGQSGTPGSGPAGRCGPTSHPPWYTSSQKAAQGQRLRHEVRQPSLHFQPGNANPLYTGAL